MQITFKKKDQEAQAIENDKKVGYCQYETKEDGQIWEITHTVVDSDYQGKGLAGKLLNCVCDKAREENVKIIPLCSYAVKKFDQESSKYQDLDAR